MQSHIKALLYLASFIERGIFKAHTNPVTVVYYYPINWVHHSLSIHELMNLCVVSALQWL